jgi:hypothetical protein
MQKTFRISVSLGGDMQRSSPAKNCSCTACECATQTSYDMPLDFINTMGPWTSTCAEAIITASHTHARIQAQTTCIRIRICLIIALKLVYHSNQAHPALEVQSKLTCKHQLRIIRRHPWRPKTAHGRSTCTAQAWTIKPDPIQKLCSGFSPCPLWSACAMSLLCLLINGSCQISRSHG